MVRSKRAIFLDRDGTLNRDTGFVHGVEELELIENVVPGLQRLASAGFRFIITTNQSGIARGRFTEDQMHAFNAALVEQSSAAWQTLQQQAEQLAAAVSVFR